MGWRGLIFPLPVIGLLVPPTARRAMKVLPVFLNYLVGSQGFGNERINEISKDNIELPANSVYLEQVLTSYLRKK